MINFLIRTCKNIGDIFALDTAAKHGERMAKNQCIADVKLYIAESEKAMHTADYKMACAWQNRAIKELLHLATWER